MSWKGGKTPGGNKCAYPCMTVDEMIQKHRPQTANDAVCFMWAVSTLLPDAIRLLEGWGFAYVNVAFVWDKGRVNLGAYTLPQMEFVLLGKKGRSGQVLKVFTSRVRQFIPDDGIRRRHSTKPDAAWQRIEELCQPGVVKLEMYARETRPGWLAFGNELVPGGGGPAAGPGGDDDRCTAEGMADDPDDGDGLPAQGVPDLSVHSTAASSLHI